MTLTSCKEESRMTQNLDTEHNEICVHKVCTISYYYFTCGHFNSESVVDYDVHADCEGHERTGSSFGVYAVVGVVGHSTGDRGTKSQKNTQRHTLRNTRRVYIQDVSFVTPIEIDTRNIFIVEESEQKK